MESTWRPYLKSQADDWTKTTDPVERRRIQNRLSQRAKRSRAAASRNPTRRYSVASQSAPLSTVSKPQPSQALITRNVSNSADLNLLVPSTLVAESGENQVTNFDDQSLEPILFEQGDLASDSSFLIMQPLRCIYAFAQIIERLELPCTYEIRTFSSPCAQIPQNLLPVQEQCRIPHLMCIDILPWPTLRANVLKQMASINLLEFTNDMQGENLKVWGTVPWDPLGWEVSQEFLNKWWFLLDSMILQSTNFWRSQRGENPIHSPHKWLEAQ